MDASWIIRVKKQSENYAHVNLEEVRHLDNGAMIFTGRRTPKLTFNILRGSFDSLTDRLKRSIEFLTAESMMAYDEESLLFAAELGERLRDVIGRGD